MRITRIALQRSPRGFQRKESQPWFDQSFDEPMILFHNVIEIVHLTQFTAFWNSALGLQLLERFGIRRVFVNRDHPGNYGVRDVKGL
jgi:hypothetical protein